MNDSMANILSDRLQKIDDEIAALKRERDEIRIAIDVVGRYMPDAQSGVNVRDEDNTEPAAKISDGSPRPDGIPTLWEMTEEVLSERPMATASDIVEFIAKKYWPGVVHAQVGPSLYRFVKESRLVRVGRGEFSLPSKENEPPLGGSETGEGDASPKLTESAIQRGIFG